MQVLKNTIKSSETFCRLVARRSNKKSLSTAVTAGGRRHFGEGQQAASFFVASSAFLLLGMTATSSSLLGTGPNITFNHCQVPCGIFDDPAIVDEMKQACTTIRKAIVQSRSLHGAAVQSDVLSMNQLVRWINTKEEHCNKIITLISDYCLCQRVKRVNFKSEEEYLQALKIHHMAMQAAMKAKQSMDEKACDNLEHIIDDLAKMYTK